MKPRLVYMERKYRTPENVRKVCDSLRQEAKNSSLPVTIITPELGKYAAFMDLLDYIEANEIAPRGVREDQLRTIEMRLFGCIEYHDPLRIDLRGHLNDRIKEIERGVKKAA